MLPAQRSVARRTWCLSTRSRTLALRPVVTRESMLLDTMHGKKFIDTVLSPMLLAHDGPQEARNKKGSLEPRVDQAKTHEKGKAKDVAKDSKSKKNKMG